MSAAADREDSDPRAGTEGSNDTFGRFIETVDLPAFIADLVKGVFQAIVDVTILQMDVYSGLVKNVAEAVGEFIDDVSGSVPSACPTCDRPTSPSAASDETGSPP